MQGRNDIEQVGKLISVLGSPCERNWKGWNVMPDHGKIIFEDNKPMDNWKSIGNFVLILASFHKLAELS